MTCVAPVYHASLEVQQFDINVFVFLLCFY